MRNGKYCSTNMALNARVAVSRVGNADNPNEVVMLLEWDNLTKARQFTQSEDLQKTMEKAGVTGKPDVYFLEKIENVAA